MNKRIWILMLVLAVLLGSAYVLYEQLGDQLAPEQLAVQTQSPAEPAQTGPEETLPGETAPAQTSPELTTAPDFTVYDSQGNPHKLSDYFGKPIVLNFWASWCGPCKSEMPEFHEKYLELQEEVQFLMVNMTDSSMETQEKASEFIAQEGFAFPVLYDLDADAAVTYSVYSLPTTYFLDAQGNLVARATGAIDADTLTQGIDMIR